MLNESEIMEALAGMEFVTAMTMPGRPCLDARCFFFQHEIEWLDHGEDGYTVLFPTEDVESAFCRAMGMVLVEQRVIDEVEVDLLGRPLPRGGGASGGQDGGGAGSRGRRRAPAPPIPGTP